MCIKLNNILRMQFVFFHQTQMSKNVLEKLKMPLILIEATHNFVKAKSRTSALADGFELPLCLSIGCKNMLHTNF